MTRVLVVGAGPAGVMAALRAADAGAKTTLITTGAFGGMAANDGPVPVRTLAHAARLMRETRQLGTYGVTVSEPVLDYPRLLARVSNVVQDVARNAALRRQLETAGVEICEHLGPAQFTDSHAMEAGDRCFEADRFILCTGGVSRRLPVPGFELTATHSGAWSLLAVPKSMIVIGAGATGAQVASVFNAMGSRVELFEAGPRILSTEEPEVSAGVAAAFREAGVVVHERFGSLTGFERTAGGIRMSYIQDGLPRQTEAELAVVAVGWVGDTAGMNLAAAGVEINERAFIKVDARQRTSAPHVYAAGDVTGRRMLAPQAMTAGFAAGGNAVTGASETADHPVNPMGSFTDPEYAQVGLGEAQARQEHDIEVVIVGFDETPRAIIDGRTNGFCKLIVDRQDRVVLGCHIVGERAVELVQMAAAAMCGGLTVDQFSRIPISFPTYAGILGRAAAKAVYVLNREPAPLVVEAG